MKVIDITPIPKPRMVNSDTWAKRPKVLKYWAFKDELNLKCNVSGITLGNELDVVFILPMPDSWSKKKKVEMDGQPHMQTPDCDNMIKAVQDCLSKQDSNIWKVSAEKRWGKYGQIIFK